MKNRFLKTFLLIAPVICLSFAIGACDNHEHAFEEKWSSDGEYHWHAATCGHDEKGERGKHDFDNGICTVCNYEDESAHKHTFEEAWSFDKDSHWHAATCVHKVISGEGTHDFSGAEGDCTVCGHNKVHFEFIKTTSSYAVTGHDDKTLESLTVPATYHGLPVTGIGFEAFKDFTLLRQITIPESVTSIEKDAFLNTAYYNKADNWQSGALYIGDCLISGSAQGAFTVKSGTRLIAAYAFADCGTLTEVNLADSCEYIGRYAFAFCRNLTAVNAGAELKYIGSYAFYYCDKLSSFNFGGDPDTVDKGAYWDEYTAL